MKPKRITAAVITLLVLVGVFLFSRPETPSTESPRRTAADKPAPENVVHRMFNAAEEGDVEAYLNCFTGRERRRLERELADQSREDYGHALRDAYAEMTGWVVQASDAEAGSTGAYGFASAW